MYVPMARSTQTVDQPVPLAVTILRISVSSPALLVVIVLMELLSTWTSVSTLSNVLVRVEYGLDPT